MSKPFIDSNVILYLLSGNQAKADIAESILIAKGIVSVQVLNEITAVCTRKLKMPWEEIECILQTVKLACDIVAVTVETHDKALQIAKRYQLSFYDALICSAALLAEAKELYSEDMQDGMRVEQLIIKNPFI